MHNEHRKTAPAAWKVPDPYQGQVDRLQPIDEVKSFKKPGSS
jgi:hypothetical protein